MSERISSQITLLPPHRPDCFPSVFHLWRESDIGAALASFLTQRTEALTDRGHWGSVSGVTLS